MSRLEDSLSGKNAQESLEGIKNLLNTEHNNPDANKGKGKTGITISRYEILEEIGKGGSGIVYKAYDPNLNRTVALKLLTSASEKGKIRLLREAKTVAAFKHQNIVQIYETGEHNGIPFMAMQFIEGIPMNEALSEATIEECIEIILKVCDAVEYAHNCGVVHRDLKPDNIIIDKNNWVYVVDFGIAKEADSVITKTDDFAGTPYYSSPEQITGKIVDYRTDIYAVGATLYHCATGRPPFYNIITSAGIPEKAITDDPAAPSRLNQNISEQLERIIKKCMHKNPAERYQSAKVLKEDLERLSEGRKITAKKPRIMQSIKPKWKNIALITAMVISVCLPLIFLYKFYSYMAAEAEAGTAREKATPYYQQAESKLKIAARAIDAESRKNLYSIMEEALTLLTKATVIDPTFADAYMGKAELHFRMGNFSQARGYLSTVLAMDPGSRQAHYFYILNEYMNNPKIMTAKYTEHEKIESYISQLKNLGGQLPQIHCAEGILKMLREDFIHAELSLSAAIEQDPTLAEAYYLRALVYETEIPRLETIEGKEGVAAVRERMFNDFMMAIKFDPNISTYYKGYIRSLISSERYEDAIRIAGTAKLVSGPWASLFSLYLMEYDAYSKIRNRNRLRAHLLQTGWIENRIKDDEMRKMLFLLKGRLLLEKRFPIEGEKEFKKAVVLAEGKEKEELEKELELLKNIYSK